MFVTLLSLPSKPSSLALVGNTIIPFTFFSMIHIPNLILQFYSTFTKNSIPSHCIFWKGTDSSLLFKSPERGFSRFFLLNLAIHSFPLGRYETQFSSRVTLHDIPTRTSSWEGVIQWRYKGEIVIT